MITSRTNTILPGSDKKKPLDKRKIAVSAAGVAAGAVLFGVIAAFVFVKSVPISDRRKNSRE